VTTDADSAASAFVVLGTSAVKAVIGSSGDIGDSQCVRERDRASRLRDRHTM